MTEEERRRDHLTALGLDPTYEPYVETPYDRLLAYLDNHEDENERALGQMLRKGVERKPVPATGCAYCDIPLYCIKETDE